MATVKEIRDELEALKASAVEEKEETRLAKEEVVAKVQALTDEVMALKEQIASGSAATASDLDGILALAKDVGIAVEGITEPPAGPPVISPV